MTARRIYDGVEYVEASSCIYTFPTKKQLKIDGTTYELSLSKLEIIEHDDLVHKCWKTMILNDSTGVVKWTACGPGVDHANSRAALYSYGSSNL